VRRQHTLVEYGRHHGVVMRGRILLRAPQHMPVKTRQRPHAKYRRLTADEKQTIRNLIHVESRANIAKRLNRSPCTVGRFISKMRLAPADPNAWTPSDISDAEHMLERDFPVRAVAAYLGRSTGATFEHRRRFQYPAIERPHFMQLHWRKSTYDLLSQVGFETGMRPFELVGCLIRVIEVDRLADYVLNLDNQRESAADG